MKFSLFIIFVSMSFLSCQSMRNTSNPKSSIFDSSSGRSSKLNIQASPLSRKSIYEELTGRQLAAASAPTQILQLARAAKSEKNYALALRRYNTLIKKFPRAQEVKAAYYDKSAMYAEMGLLDQSKFNLQLAQQFKVLSYAKSNVAKTQRVTVRSVATVQSASKIKKSGQIQKQGNQVTR